MSEKRNRWIINTILILAVLAFVGISMLPLLEGAFRRGQSSDNTRPSPTANTVSQQTELETQAKGYELVLQREPDNQTALRGLRDARLQLSELKLKQGDFEGARTELKATLSSLEKLVQLNPNETRYGVLLAQTRQYLNDPEGAAQAYRNVLTTKPGDLLALQGLTVLFLKQNRPEAAIALLQDTLKTAPKANQIQANSIDVTSVQLLLGQVYADQKRYDEAIAIYSEAAKGNKSDFRPVLAKAIILQEQGKTEEAKIHFKDAVALAPAQYKDEINKLANSSPNSSLIPSATESEPNLAPSIPAKAVPSPPVQSSPAPSPSPSN